MHSNHSKARRAAMVFFGAIVLFLVCASIARAAAPVSASINRGELGQPKHLTMMIVYATVALFFSFLCSVAEAVVLSVSPSYIANLRNAGNERAADRLGQIKSNIDRSLAAILTLNTIAHTVGAGGAGAEAAAYFGDKYVGVSMAVLTLLILFLSEIIPKTLGALYWRSLAPMTATFVRWLGWVLYPLLFVSEKLMKLLTRGETAHPFSRDEFTAMVEIGQKAGQLDATESRILSNLLRFPELCAEDIMTPRTVVFMLQQDLTVAEVFAVHAKIAFSRIPIYAENRDAISGFVLLTDLLLRRHGDAMQTPLRELKREIRSVYDHLPLSRVLEDVLDNRAHIVLVVDEHGGTEGIVTLEDVVETLIGIEIVDETDTIDDMRRLARQKWQARMKKAGIDAR